MLKKSMLVKGGSERILLLIENQIRSDFFLSRMNVDLIVVNCF
jgi:hypothetical protein